MHINIQVGREEKPPRYNKCSIRMELPKPKKKRHAFLPAVTYLDLVVAASLESKLDEGGPCEGFQRAVAGDGSPAVPRHRHPVLQPRVPADGGGDAALRAATALLRRNPLPACLNGSTSGHRTLSGPGGGG